MDRDSPATGLTPPTLSVRHGLITSALPDAGSMTFATAKVRAVIRQPMQQHAHAYASRLSRACLLQVPSVGMRVPAAGMQPLHDACLSAAAEGSFGEWLMLAASTLSPCARRVPRAGQCTLPQLDMGGIQRLLLHGPSAFDDPVGLMSKICLGTCVRVAGSMCNMAAGRFEVRGGTRIGRCCRVAR